MNEKVLNMSENMIEFLMWAFIEPETPEQRSMCTLLNDLMRTISENHEQTGRAHVHEGDVEFIFQRGRRVFCRIEPKLMVEDGHDVAVVNVFVRGAKVSELRGAGAVLRAPTRVAVRNKRGVKTLAPLIRRAFEQAGVAPVRK
jgi:hypothetical protein